MGDKDESDDGQEEEMDDDATEDLDLSKAPREEESFDEFSGKVRKFWGEEQKKKEEAELRKKVEAENNIDEAFEDAAFELKQDNDRKIKALRKRLDGTVVVEHVEEEEDEEGKDELIQADSLNFKVRPDSDQAIATLGSSIGKELSAKEQAAVLPDVDPSKFMEPTPISGSQLPEIIGYNEEENNMEDEEEEQSQKDLIAEAFADDDVVESFRAEKEALVAASKPKNIDLTLPGWGEWGGGGAVPSKRKRKGSL